MDAAQEHLWVRQACGLVGRDNTVCLDITGEDRAKLLQGLLANDVEKLKPGQGCLSHLLTPKGKIQAQLEVLALTDRLRLLTDSAVADLVTKNIQMRIFRAQVRLEDRRRDFSMMGLHGPKAPEALRAALGQVLTLDTEYAHATVQIEGTELEVIREHYTGELGFDFLVPAAAAAAVKARFLALEGVQPVGAEALASLTLEAGVPLWGIDFTDDHLSFEANLNKAVSNSKGCYLGQETVARMLSRGHVAKRLVGLVLDAAVPAGTRVFPEAQSAVSAEDRALGTVTRSAASPTLETNLALAYLRFDFLEENPGAALGLFDPAGRRLAGARWQELPFVKGSAPSWLAGGPQPERVVAPQARTH